MKRFIIYLLYFSILPFLIFTVFEITIYSLKSSFFLDRNLQNVCIDEANDYEWIKTIKSDSLKFLAGSSSVKYGLSCKILNHLSSRKFNYVNIAMDARDPIQTYFIIKNLNLKNVSAVYFGLDPWIFTKSYYMYKDGYLYLDFSLLEILKFSNEHDISSFRKRYKGLFDFFLFNIHKNDGPLNNIIPADFGSAVIEGQAINFNQPINDWFQIDKYGWSDLQFLYLQKISELCRERNIKFAVFVPPKRSDYSKVYKEKCGVIHDEYTRKLVDFGFNSPIFGQYDQLDKFGDENNFTEAFHLNKKGQEVYSLLFYKLTQKPINGFSEDYNWFLKI